MQFATAAARRVDPDDSALQCAWPHTCGGLPGAHYGFLPFREEAMGDRITQPDRHLPPEPLTRSPVDATPAGCLLPDLPLLGPAEEGIFC
jgi:hypothetical protein